MILLLLGFWDLFAVMTPIGPLRWLVDLVHEKGTPLPGLLFQADIVDAHVDPSSSKSGERTAAATKDLAVKPSEEEFIANLLSSAPPHPPPTRDTQVPQSSPLPEFHHHVHAFLQSRHSRFLHRSREIAHLYEARQLDLWRYLYSYYNVEVVDLQQLCPLVQHGFPASTFKPPHHNSPSAPSKERKEEGYDYGDKCIKLGLGDFIFYSVLVARAATHGMAVFAPCFLCILVVRPAFYLRTLP